MTQNKAEVRRGVRSFRATALDHAARDHRQDEPPPPNREMYNALTSVLENWHAADTLREDSLLLAEWLAVELCGYLYGQLNQNRDQLDQWLREFGPGHGLRPLRDPDTAEDADDE